jgi:predicted transcriptional regulator
MSENIITKLRDCVPIRPLRYSEALRIAELQAQKFLAMSGITMPPVPERAISELPRVHVTRLSPFPASGATHWTEGRWLIALNGAEPNTRQRFSLAHEFKHIIDHRFVDVIYANFPLREREAMIEQICDFFAGCLLMPRTWVKTAYCSGNQHLPTLAKTFGVSQAAMNVRLNQIGLVEPTSRCVRPKSDWTLEAMKELTGPMKYQRALAVDV